MNEDVIMGLEWSWVIPAAFLPMFNLESWYESDEALLMRSEIWHYGMRCTPCDKI